MTSLAQTLANRRNAAKSTGPRTHAGKSRSSRNAINHALSAWTPDALPGESASAFKAFAAAVIADLNPLGPLESHWATRIALLLWRLRRTTRHEAALAAARLRDADLAAPDSPRWKHRHQTVKDLPKSLHAARFAANACRRALSLLNKTLVNHAAPATPSPAVKPADAVNLIQRTAETFGFPEIAELDEDPYPGIGPLESNADPLSYTWDLPMLHNALSTLADEAKLDFHLFLHDLIESLNFALRNHTAARERAERQLALFRLECTLPDPQSLRLLDRHEASLERNLSRALSQLAFLQTQRASTAPQNTSLAPQNTPPAPLLIHQTPQFPA